MGVVHFIRQPLAVRFAVTDRLLTPFLLGAAQIDLLLALQQTLL